VSFRDDSDALLARNAALEAENARLTEELGEARAELEGARQQIADLEEAKRELEARPPVREPERKRPRPSGGKERDLRLWGALPAAAILVVMSIWWTCARGGDDERPKPGLEPATAWQDNDELAQITAVRQCLDNGDLYLRLFLAAPADARRKDLLGHVRNCAVMVDGIHDDGIARAATPYLQRLAELRPAVEELFAYFDSGAELHDTDGAKRRALEAAMAAHAAGWLATSDALRAATVEPYERAKAIGARRAVSQGGQLELLRFSAAAASFLDALVAPMATVEDCAAAAEAMNAAHRDAGTQARGRWVDLINHARAIVEQLRAAGQAGVSAAVAPRVLGLVSAYNAEGLGRPYPF
jgi:hypothetical protein